MLSCTVSQLPSDKKGKQTFLQGYFHHTCQKYCFTRPVCNCGGFRQDWTCVTTPGLCTKWHPTFSSNRNYLRNKWYSTASFVVVSSAAEMVCRMQRQRLESRRHDATGRASCSWSKAWKQILKGVEIYFPLRPTRSQIRWRVNKKILLSFWKIGWQTVLQLETA